MSVTKCCNATWKGAEWKHTKHRHVWGASSLEVEGTVEFEDKTVKRELGSSGQLLGCVPEVLCHSRHTLDALEEALSEGDWDRMRVKLCCCPDIAGGWWNIVENETLQFSLNAAPRDSLLPMTELPLSHPKLKSL